MLTSWVLHRTQIHRGKPGYPVKALHRSYIHQRNTNKSGFISNTSCKTAQYYCLVAIHTATAIPFIDSFSGNCAASAPVSTFMCLWAIYIFPGSGNIFPPAEKADPSWEYIIRSQTHECGSLDWGPDIPFLGIFVSNFRHFVFAVQSKMQSNNLLLYTHPPLPIVAILSNSSCETAKYWGQISSRHYDAVQQHPLIYPLPHPTGHISSTSCVNSNSKYCGTFQCCLIGKLNFQIDIDWWYLLYQKHIFESYKINIYSLWRSNLQYFPFLSVNKYSQFSS